MSRDAIKKAVGSKAAEFVKEGMLVGLGTGTTVFYFIEKLGQLCKEGLNITAVASSSHSLNHAQKMGIPLADMDAITTVDLTVDGADEIDSQKRMIKGGGGALVREKILANMSREMVVIVDEKKLVHSLGKCKLPVEILPFGRMATLHHIAKAGYRGEFRKGPDGGLFVTDNQNLVVDIQFDRLRENPEEDHETLIHIPGVIDTGFFSNLAGRVIIGFEDGQVITKS